jgi:hypothetical protein
MPMQMNSAAALAGKSPESVPDKKSLQKAFEAGQKLVS